MLSASESIPIARERAVKPFGYAARKGDAEQPAHQAYSWQDLQQLLQGGCATPGFSVFEPDHLNRLFELVR